MTDYRHYHHIVISFGDGLRTLWSLLLKVSVCFCAHGGRRRRYFRHVSQGGWPFSTSAHGWPISDCTAEGLKAVLLLRRELTTTTAAYATISDQRLFDAVNVLLTLHNPGEGGWATYEQTRGWRWFESLNPSEVFGDIMIDYSYVATSYSEYGPTTILYTLPS